MRRLTVASHLRKSTLRVMVLLLFLLAVPSTALAKVKPGPLYTVRVDSGYLAMRTAPSYNAANEFGELYTGDAVRVIDSKSNATYWKVKSRKYKRAGWVNKNYLVYMDASHAQGSYRVSVAKGYLALRSAPSYNESNEIGELYTGDTVRLIYRYSDTYWWVYSPKYDRLGYVNCNYLGSGSGGSSSGSYGTYRVSVSKGYLALRSAPSYNDANEIGELYTGDTVTVQDKSNGQYWWVYSPKYGRSGYVNKDYLVR